MELFEKFKSGLKKTRSVTIGRLEGLFKRGKISTELLDDLEEALYVADIGVESVDDLLKDLKNSVRENKIRDVKVPVEILKEKLTELLIDVETIAEPRFSKKPWVIMLVGVNGAGKTTTAGKLAHLFAQEGKSTAIAAADTFRAGAIEQVAIWAERSKSRLIKQAIGGDPAAVTFDAYTSVLSRREDALIIDTAGRLQDKHNLMRELGKMTKVLKNFDQCLPNEVLLIIDATTGQNGLSQAKGFTETAQVTGIIVTKLDGSARGGVIVPIIREMKIPIEFVGMGESINDLYRFNAKDYANALFVQN